MRYNFKRTLKIKIILFHTLEAAQVLSIIDSLGRNVNGMGNNKLFAFALCCFRVTVGGISWP
jgi:hypothetical protein